MPSAVAMAERTVSHRLDLQNPMVLLHIKYQILFRYQYFSIYKYNNIFIYRHVYM